MERTGLRTVELGRTGMHVTRVGLGAWAIGGAGWWHAWGTQDDEESIATIRRAFALGINWVDTAPIYGLGHSEDVVGRAIEGLSGAMTAERVAALPDDDWRKHDARFREPELPRHLALVARLQEVADRHDTTAGAIAVAWTLHHPAVSGAIVGFRRPDQVEPLTVAANLELTDQDLATIAAG